MNGVGHAKPVGHGAAKAANSPPFPNFCKECDRKVRFGERARSVGSGSGGNPTAKQLKDKVVEKPRPSRPQDAVTLKDKPTGELPPFGEIKAHHGQEIRLRGKLKWLFEQDRMFWESNSAKSSRRSSFEADRFAALNVVPTTTTTTAKPAVDSPNDAELVHVVEESFKRVCSSKKPPVNDLKPPRQAPPTDKAMVSKGEGPAIADRHTISSLAKIPWTFSNSTAKFWPRGKSKAQDNSNSTPNAESKTRLPTGKQSSVDHNKRVKANESATLMSREEILSDYDDAPKSGDSSEVRSSDDEEEEVRKKVNETIDRGGDGSLQDVKNQAACLKVKCDLLSKEKDHALRKWKKSCQEIDDAAKMAQALRTAIETLLEASASDSRADFKARQDILEDQTQALKVRMENLRRKNSEGLRRQAQEKAPSAPLEDRIETLRKSSEGRSLASPEIPRDAEYKVEALRARLEKLMLATNSLVSDEQRVPPKAGGEQNKLVEDWLQHQKSHSDEKAELKMKSWLNSLSAELASEESSDTSRGVCEKSNGTSGCVTPYISKQGIPSTTKQESPWSSSHDRDRDAPGSAPSSVETKKNVIHKIAEEVQFEAKQWFQVQELLGRVGEDMKSLQEACSTWERRAILAEAQVVHMQHEGHDMKEKTLQLGDEKIAELQKEMLRLRETVDDVKKQIGNINIDPSRWFEAAQTFGYAFMPVHLRVPDASCACKSACDHSSCGKGTPDSRDQWRPRTFAATSVMSQPSCSGSTTTASPTISSSEKSPPESEGRLRSQIPSQQWAKEVAKAEEDEILTTANTTGQVPKLEFPNNTMSSASDGKSQEKLQDRIAKLAHKEMGLESSDSTGEMLLQRQASNKDTSGVFHQEEQPPRYSNLPTSRRSRSPLKDVLENITSSKENKRPY